MGECLSSVAAPCHREGRRRRRFRIARPDTPARPAWERFVDPTAVGGVGRIRRASPRPRFPHGNRARCPSRRPSLGFVRQTLIDSPFPSQIKIACLPPPRPIAPRHVDLRQHDPARRARQTPGFIVSWTDQSSRSRIRRAVARSYDLNLMMHPDVQRTTLAFYPIFLFLLNDLLPASHPYSALRQPAAKLPFVRVVLAGPNSRILSLPMPLKSPGLWELFLRSSHLFSGHGLRLLVTGLVRTTPAPAGWSGQPRLHTDFRIGL